MEERCQCTMCLQEVNREDLFEFSDELLCHSCLEEETTTCDRCGDRIWRDDAESDSKTAAPFPNDWRFLMNEAITVLVVEPGKMPYTKAIGFGLKSLQKEVCGYIEALYPFPEPVAIVCNETAKLNGLPLNRTLRDDAGEIYDIIARTFLVVGLTEEDFGSLPPALIQQFTRHFQEPELFLRINGNVVVIPTEE